MHAAKADAREYLADLKNNVLVCSHEATMQLYLEIPLLMLKTLTTVK
jgi:hypothetical protein